MERRLLNVLSMPSILNPLGFVSSFQKSSRTETTRVAA
jgi:hypothetical protein